MIQRKAKSHKGNGVKFSYNMYNYTSYDSIPEYMEAYLLEVGNVKRINQLSLKDINDFLNGLEEWYSDPLYGKSYRNGRT